MSISKRQTKRRVVWDVRLRTPAGRQYTRTFDTKREAESFEASERADRSRGTWIDPERASRTTVRAWSQEWRSLNRRKAPTTRETDRIVLDRHVLPLLGDASVGEVRPLDIQRLVAEWTDAYAAATVRRYYGVVRAMFYAAVNADVIGRSPCRGVRLPEVPETAHVILTPHQLSRLAAELPGKYAPMAYVGAVLGLRFEEVAGLRVRSLDPDARTISVTETVTSAAGRLYIGPPKTAAGHRTLAAPESLVDMLQRHVETEALSEAEDLLFPDSRGGPLRYSNFRRRVWDPACERAELPKVGFHDLRRTAITAMVAAGVDVKTAQTRAGHSDPRMTLAVYAKATETADRAAADAVGKLFLTADD